MNEQENALPLGGLAKPAQKPEKIWEIDREDRISLALTLVFCLLVVDSILWYGPMAGVTASVLLWYVLVLRRTGAAPLRRWENRILLTANLLLALTFVLSSSWYFRLWNFLALAVLLPVHAFSLSGGAALPWWRPAMLWERFRLLLGGLFGSLGALVPALTPPSVKGNAKRIAAVTGGCAAALVLVAILLPVLTSADALFAAATWDLRLFIDIHLSEALWKLITALLLTPFFFSLLYRLRRPQALKPPAPAKVRVVDGALFAIVLTALDLLYLAFLAVQSAGLFGGPEYLEARGISYADWARSGFFQMVGVTAVNLSVILAAAVFPAAPSRFRRLLATLLGLESYALLASALWRMCLYVSAYGLSFKRVMTWWGMAMMALFFAAALAKVWRPAFSFCRLAFPLALAGWLAINCVPIDYLVARDNVDRYLSGESPALSVHYLVYDLSYDALSQLDRLDGSRRLASLEGDWWGPSETVESLLSTRRDAARRECARWQTWSLSAWLAASGGGAP